MCDKWFLYALGRENKVDITQWSLSKWRCYRLHRRCRLTGCRPKRFVGSQWNCTVRWGIEEEEPSGLTNNADMSFTICSDRQWKPHTCELSPPPPPHPHVNRKSAQSTSQHTNKQIVTAEVSLSSPKPADRHWSLPANPITATERLKGGRRLRDKKPHPSGCQWRIAVHLCADVVKTCKHTDRWCHEVWFICSHVWRSAAC